MPMLWRVLDEHMQSTLPESVAQMERIDVQTPQKAVVKRGQ